MTTAVTGGNGFIGSHVVHRLLARGEHVRILARAGADLQALRGLPIEIVYGDLCDRSTLTPFVRGAGRVFHVAADYRLWARDPRVLYATNVDGTNNLIGACAAAGVERFIFTSTVGTVAIRRHEGLADESVEATLGDMIGPYKRSKFLAEQAVRRAADGGFPAVIVNPTTPVGPGDWKPTPTGRMVVDFVNGRMPAYLDTGLNLVPVEDVAEGHLLASERGRIGQRYLLGGVNLRLQEIWKKLADIIGIRAPALRVPYAAAAAVGCASELLARLGGREPRVPLDAVRMARHPMFADVSYARDTLGFEAGSVDAALERAVRWYVARGYVRVAASALRSAARGGSRA
jgi:dihydroflavonol-4-reductase